MTKGSRYTGLKPLNYKFKSRKESRDVIAFYAGDYPLGFIEYSVARRLVDQVHDLCDDYEREQRQKGTT